MKACTWAPSGGGRCAAEQDDIYVKSKRVSPFPPRHAADGDDLGRLAPPDGWPPRRQFGAARTANSTPNKSFIEALSLITITHARAPPAPS